MVPNFSHPSPDPGMLNVVQTPAMSGGSQTGSEYDFGTPQSASIDNMMMQAADGMNYRQTFTSMPTGHGAYDRSGLMHSNLYAGQMSQREMLPDQSSSHAQLRGQRHRLSIGSSGHSVGGAMHHSSPYSEAGGMDGMLGGGGIGGNHGANGSNESITSQPFGEDQSAAQGDSLGNAPPTWSELKTKAGKERKRLPLACIACRRKKIRCSGEKPACKHCLRSRIPCVYKVTTRKAAPRTDYMAMLDKRLKRMEERVIKIIPKEEQGIVLSTGRASVKPPLPSATPKAVGPGKKRGADAAFEDELDVWADVRPGAGQNSEDAIKAEEQEPLKVQESDEHNLLYEGADSLPSKDLQEHLAEVFFDYVYGQSYPLLHKPSFMRRLAAGQVPPVLTLAVCAISARFSNHPELRTEPAFLRGELWAGPARDIALRRYDTPNITILICYLLLGLHEFGTCHGGRSWMLGGMAQRMAYALQLHKDLEHDWKGGRGPDKSELTFTDREIRRRTMWSCFLMDRFNSSGTDRPLFVGEQYITAQLPIAERYYQMEITGPTEDLDGGVPNPLAPGVGQLSDAKENMGTTAYLIRLVAIWGKLINYMNLGGKDLDEHPMWDERSRFHQIKVAAQAWQASLPARLLYTPDNLQSHISERIANHFIFLHICYHQIILFMTRFALPSPGSKPRHNRDMPDDFVAESSKAALEAANQISVLINEAMDHNVVAPFAGYCAFYSSTVHIHGVFSNNTALEALSKRNLAWNVKFLSKMKKYWGMFHFVTENLRDLYRRHADAARSGSKAGPRDSGDNTIFQYGDWFDRYPHGVSGTDYEEPSAEGEKEPGADAVLGQKSDLQTVEEFFSKLAPPSRATAKGRQQYQNRKTVKRRHTKSETKLPTNQPQQGQRDGNTGSTPERNDLMPTQTFSGAPSRFPQAPPNLPAGFSPTSHPYFSNPMPPQFMSEIDRQMVLSSYAGLDPSHEAFNIGPDPTLDQSGHMNLDNFDFAAFASANGDPSPDPYWNQSTAWFLPFNMEPPALGEDNGSFLSAPGFDMSSMEGFGNLPPDIAPIGLTPGGSIDLEGGRENLGARMP